MNRYELVNNNRNTSVNTIVAKVGQVVSIGVTTVHLTASMQIEDVASGKYRFGTNLS